MEKLHPGAKWLFRIRVYFGLAFIFMFSGFFIPSFITLFTSASKDAVQRMIIELFISFFIGLIVIISIGEIYARLAYNNWRYELTNSSLRLERGIIWKRYSNIPYERVQNVDISRGILARIIGFSTLNIQTAGYHYTGRSGAISEGYIPAVSIKKAEEIREFLMKKIGKRQGL